MKAKLPQDLKQKALILLFLEVIFGSITYKILRRPYNGEAWSKIAFWLVFIIATTVFAANLQLLGRMVGARKKLTGDQRIAVILFCVSLLFILMLNLIYWSQTSSTG